MKRTRKNPVMVLALMLGFSALEDAVADNIRAASVAGTTSYAIGVPLTYVSIGSTAAAIHGSNVGEGTIIIMAASGLVLNNGGLVAGCVAANRSVKALNPTDPLREAARECRRNYGYGAIPAVGSAALCSIGGLAAAQGSRMEPFLIGGALLLVVRDIFWSRAAFGAAHVVKQVSDEQSGPTVSLSPMFSPAGALGGGVSLHF